MLTLALWLSASWTGSAQTQQCVETNGYKFIALPQVDGGMDVRDSQGDIVLADDFFCNSTGRVTDIHLWGSWLSNLHGTITNFWLGIYSDVPAVTNFAGGQVTNSHPGVLLWQQSFGLGQFAESPYGTGSETFYDPVSSGVIGSDTEAWYYCFYPTNPFVQQGTANKPTNYWLAVYAQFNDPTTLYGWKTAITPYNDAAVWSPVQPGTGLPIGVWQSMTNFQAPQPQPINLAFKITTPTNPPPPAPCCPDTNGVKWVQSPDFISGIDYNATQPFILADDFKCTTRGRITDIHLWGSWLSDQVDPGATFTLAIWSDAPTNVDRPFSHPGNLLWSQVFAPGNYTICPYTNVAEPFYDPGAAVALGSSTNLFYLCFFPDPASAFSQAGTPNQPTNYWLSVTVTPSIPTAPIDFGWKSSAAHYNDTAVQTTVAFPPPTGAWNPFFDPQNGHVDLAFKITTATNNQPPPVVCVESDFEKYVQGPNLFAGFDVWNTPYVLADDFLCTNTGPISDIHLWGSWLNDVAQTNTIIFWLGIYDDVPVGTGNTFSHPGTNLLWSQWFVPGQYAEMIWSANAFEQFLDPGPTNNLGSDSVVWYYCFYPTNAFQQTGTQTNSKTYWLAAYAQLPVGGNFNYGWKTATNVLKDTSVHAVWPGSPPIGNPGWTPTAGQPPAGGPAVPLDLAFKITMCGPVLIHWLPPTNVVVTWPGAGYLQSATNVNGPYLDVPGFPTSPYTDYSVTPTNKFYRLRCY